MNLKPLIKLANSLKSYDKDASNYLNNLIFKIAGHLEDLIAKHPQYENDLNLAAASNVKPAHLIWVVKQLEKNEPISEIINMIDEFNKNRQRLEKKDLFQYQTLGELRGKINEIGLSRRQQKLKEKTDVKQNLQGQYDVLYDDGDYLVVHPHSKEASCYFGQGTQWCVAATTSRNYFNDYAGRNIFLYYILSRHPDPNNPDMEKIAFAFQPYTYYNEIENRESKTPLETHTLDIFNVKDDRINEEEVEHYLGYKYSAIKSVIFNHLGSQKETKFQIRLKNLNLEEFRKERQSLDEFSLETSNFEDRVLDVTSDPEIITEIYNNLSNYHSVIADNMMAGVAKNPATPQNILDDLIDKYLNKMSDDPFSMPGLMSVKFYLLKNPSLSPENIKTLWSYYKTDLGFFGSDVDSILQHPNTPPDVLEEILVTLTRKYKNAASIGSGDKIPIGLVFEFVKKYDFNKQPQIADKLLNFEFLIKHLLRNPNLPDEIYTKILEKVYDVDFFIENEEEVNNIMSILAKTNVPDFVVKTLAEREQHDPSIIIPLTMNSVLAKYPKLLWKLSESPDFRIRAFIASSKYTPKELLEKLSHDSNKDVASIAQSTLYDVEVNF